MDYNADQPIGRYREAKFALARHDPTGALAHLRKAAAWDPYSPPFRLDMADVLTQLGRTNEAVQELQELCRLQPQSVEVYPNSAWPWPTTSRSRPPSPPSSKR